MTPITDPDIWLHLRTGQWIVEHWTVPTTDPFSNYGIGKPWIAYSWLFDLLVYSLYRAFGLTGVVAYTVALSLSIAVALHTVVWRLQPHFTFAAAITALGLISLFPLLNPRPWLFTILFFVVELHLLLEAREQGNARGLLFLPPLFALWANLHIQFVYGLFLLGLAAAEPLISRSLRFAPAEAGSKTISYGCLLLVLPACALATLATPYHIQLYYVILDYIGQNNPSHYIKEHMPLEFRSPFEWSVLVLTLCAVFAIGWRRQVRIFAIALLVAGIFLSFRSRRDLWFVVICAVTTIASFRSKESVIQGFRVTKLRATLVGVSILIALMLIGRIRNISEGHLQETVVKTYPEKAAAIVEQRGYPGPLYNPYHWGDYLIWRLPNLPVAMDGRTNLHGDKRIERAFKTWAGGREWASDPELAAARLVIADVNLALTSLLRLDPRFELVYEDKVAAVFVARAQDEER